MTCILMAEIGKSIMAKNFCTGAPWLPGVTTEKIGPVTYLVQVKSNLTWKCHIDHATEE